MAHNEYLRLNDTEMNIRKAENYLAVIEQKRKADETVKDVQSEDSLFAELFKAFKEFFLNLGRPTLKKKLLKEKSPTRSQDYNDTMLEIYNDVGVAYKETDSLSTALVKNFNYGESERQTLLNKIRKLSSQSVDYSFYSKGAKTRSLFGIDNFVDSSKIDFSKISPGMYAAELITNQGIVTLKRLDSENLSPTVGLITGIKESKPTWNPMTERGGYEGLYFGVRNEARPEGGTWHVQHSSGGTRLFETGASEDELMPIRLNMFDDNPDTFWEVEFITQPVAGYRHKYTGRQISVAEFNSLIDNEINSPNVEVRGGTVITDEYGSLVEDYIPISESEELQRLDIVFDAHLHRARQMNWISLLPHNFGQELYMQVLSIQTSPDGKRFEKLEGFDDYEYDITLTSRANEELTPRQIQDTLAPDRFKFAGHGVWSFAAREVKVARFHLRQLRSYCKLYEILMVEVSQDVTTTTTKTRWWGLSKKTSTSTTTVKQDVEIPYLVGQITGFDVMDLEPGGIDIRGFDYAGEAIVGATLASFAAGLLLSFPVAIGVAVLALIFSGIFGSSKKTETTVGPQRITKQWTVLKDDISRFAIGIRDINLYSYLFAEISEVISQPYISPRPIDKIALTVEEQIPKIFYNRPEGRGTENDWIKYYISVDDGTSWRRISPRHHRATISEDGRSNVPQIINVNSDVAVQDRHNPLAYIDTGIPIYSVRFKAVLTRPTDIPNANNYTPVLMQYALQIYPKGGL